MRRPLSPALPLARQAPGRLCPRPWLCTWAPRATPGATDSRMGVRRTQALLDRAYIKRIRCAVHGRSCRDCSSRRSLRIRQLCTVARHSADECARARACTMPRMKNFMAYEDSTVFPGTALNLVVGPNGAGKSTIVGAMVLGLGFPLKVCPCPPRMRAPRGRCPALRQHAQRLSASPACSGGDWRALCADDEPMPAVLLWADYGSRAECHGLDPQRGGGGRARGGLEQA